ncbi:MAG TPA: CARDB domain-containing protein [Candidatus Thermoplasmatota archaeon]|nr:CARDB domain-containing protein [Candidatus Thermoplasmatota archaeon]
MRALLATAALGAVLLSALWLAGDASAARESTVVALAYNVDVTQPTLLDQGIVQVTLEIRNARDRVLNFTLRTATHEYAVLRLFNDLGGTLRQHAGGWNFTPTSDVASFMYEINVRKPATTPSEYNSWLSPAFGVVKAEALSIPFDYTYYCPVGWTGGQPCPGPNFTAAVTFRLPAGWNVEAPWEATGPGQFVLPAGDAIRGVLPRGFVALGPFSGESQERAGKTFVYARLSGELADRSVIFDYLEAATPYYASVYGNVTRDKILVISAGAPMFHGGLGSTDSLFVHQNATLKTIAHEYAHTYQMFQAHNVAGASTIWINEGDADYHGAISRFVAGFLSLDLLNAELRSEYENRTQDPNRGEVALTSPVYGADDQQVAYRKGMFTLAHLGSELSGATNGRATLATIMTALNQEYVENISRNTSRLPRVTNDDMLRVVNRLARSDGVLVDFSTFFDLYVFGPTYPPFREVVALEDIVLEALRASPSPALPGQPVQVTVEARNRGPTAAERVITLRVGGQVVGTQTLSLGIGESGSARFVWTPDEPGDYVLEAAYLQRILPVLVPAEFAIVGMDPTPTFPMALRPFDVVVFVRNTGQAPGEALVRVNIGETERTAALSIPGGVTARASVAFTLPEAGEYEIAARLDGSEAPPRRQTLRVDELDSDGDGVPDARDAYPHNPNLWESNPVNDVRNATPAWESLPLAVGFCALLLRRRRA